MLSISLGSSLARSFCISIYLIFIGIYLKPAMAFVAKRASALGANGYFVVIVIVVVHTNEEYKAHAHEILQQNPFRVRHTPTKNCL